jgi:hypothetical protein
VACAAALASAREVEALLQAMDIPCAPAGFTPLVLQRIRRDRWRSEQHVDLLFNIAIAAAVILVVGAIAGMLNVAELLAISAWMSAVLEQGTREALQRAAPAAAIYAAAAALLASALGIWWWAERRLQF